MTKRKLLASLFFITLTSVTFTSYNITAAPVWFNNVTVSKVVTISAANGSTNLQIWGTNGCSRQGIVDNNGNIPQFITSVITTNTLHMSYIMSMSVSANNTIGKTISFRADCATNSVDQFCVGNSTIPGTC